MADEEEKGEVPVPPKSNKMLILVLVLVAAVGGGTGAYFAFAKGGSSAAKPAGPDPTQGGKHIVSQDVFIVNLDEPGATRYLKIAVDLEMVEPPKEEMSQSLSARMRDKTIVYLSSLKVAQIQKADAKEKVRAKLLKFANQVYGKGMVTAIYFKAFVMQ